MPGKKRWLTLRRLAIGAAVSATGGLTLPAARARQPPAAVPMPADEAMARKVCAGCHAFPPPDSFPRARWKTTVMEMTSLTLAGIGAPRDAPPPTLDFDPDLITRFYETRAPESLAAAASWPPPASPAPFARHAFGLRQDGVTHPAVANVRFLDLDGDGRLQIAAADMSAGLVLAADPARPQAGLRILARVPHPCHLEAVDLDRDGLIDLVVADLGGVAPGDYTRGSVVWLRRTKEGGYETHVLASGLPRVADVRPADVDGDGDVDLIVAAFGWREVGGIFLLENRGGRGDAPVFVRREIDPRQGAIHVPVVDLDGDGKLDFVALIAQHHEAVVAFLGDGKGGFRPRTLHAAAHPGWGSSGLERVDFDGDGDLDLLVTNGDMLDDFLVKPYHGIRWLENRGGLSFQEHELATLPGVHRALAVDVDGDGDLDVVAAAFVPPPRRPEDGPRGVVASLVWLEQVSPGRFERRTLETGGQHATLDAADYDGDGDVDLVVGSFALETGAWVELWENRRVSGAKPAAEAERRRAAARAGTR